MKLRNIIFAFLCAALLFTVSACGEEPPPEASPTPSVSPSPSSAPSEEPTIQPGQIDFEAAYTAYNLDDVMFTVNGLDVTWDLLYFFIANAIEEVIYYTGETPDLDDSEICEQIITRAMDGILIYKTVESMAEKENITLSGEDREMMLIERENEAAQFGGEEAFKQYLHDIYQSEEVYEYLKSIQYLFKNIINGRYGLGAAELPDDDVALVTENQDWLMAKHILFLTRVYNDDGTYTDMSEEEKSVALEHALDITAQLDSYDGDNFDAFFDELMFEHSEDTNGLLGFPDGYLYSSGVMVAEFEQATRDLEIGSFTTEPVESVHGYHIIYRLPVDFDAVPTNSSVSLREIAAQTIVSDEAEAVYEALTIENTPAYESFDISNVFAVA